VNDQEVSRGQKLRKPPTNQTLQHKFPEAQIRTVDLEDAVGPTSLYDEWGRDFRRRPPKRALFRELRQKEGRAYRVIIHRLGDQSYGNEIEDTEEE
jgi:hypothetical protein